MPNRNFINWFFVSALLMGIIFFFFPVLAEKLYGEWIFPSIRLFFNVLSFISPIPIVYFFISWVLFLSWKNIAVWMKGRKKIIPFFYDLFYFCLFMAAIFYWFWGMNYFRSNEVERLGLHPEAVDKVRLTDWTKSWTEKVNQSRTLLIQNEQERQGFIFSRKTLKTELEVGFQQLMRDHGFIEYRHLPILFWRPKGLWLRNSAAGFYFPFTGEATLDSGLHPFQVPFTMAHEMAHAIGFTDEGVCNLLALIVCLRSEDPFIRYSGKLTFWRYLARELRRLDPEFYSTVYNEILTEVVKEDLKSIHENSLKYADWFPGLQRKVYDTYLRAHGITEGVSSYSEVLMLADSYFELFTEGKNDFD